MARENSRSNGSKGSKGTEHYSFGKRSWQSMWKHVVELDYVFTEEVWCCAWHELLTILDSQLRNVAPCKAMGKNLSDARTFRRRAERFCLHTDQHP